DKVWKDGMPDWTEAGKVEGLCAARPPAPPPLKQNKATLVISVPSPASMVADITAKAVRGYVKLASYGLLGGKLTGEESFKLYLDGKFVGEGPYKEGFEVTAECEPGARRLEVAHWRGTKE